MLRALLRFSGPAGLALALSACALSPSTRYADQNVPPPQQNGRDQLPKSEQPSLPGDQKIERIGLDEGGARIDELRVGGETQRITVQPKQLPLPAYEIVPTDGARRASDFGRNASDAGARASVWNILNF